MNRTARQDRERLIDNVKQWLEDFVFIKVGY